MTRDIAKRLGRGLSTVSQEVARCGGRNDYDALKAQEWARHRQRYKKRACLKVALDPYLCRRVEADIRGHVSPERISGRLRLEGKPYASPKAIRKFAHMRHFKILPISQGILQALARIPDVRGRSALQDVSSLMIRAASETETGTGRVTSSSPARTRRRSWSWWSVAPKTRSSAGYRTARTTRCVARSAMPCRQAVRLAHGGQRVRLRAAPGSVITAVSSGLLRPTVPFHRQGARQEHRPVDRWFIPKRTDLRKVTIERVRNIEDWLNNVPRQCLGFHTSREMTELSAANAV